MKVDFTSTHSGKSSSGEASIQNRMANAKHYTEDARLQEVIKLYSSLEDREDHVFSGSG
jgi:hypothetical protein